MAWSEYVMAACAGKHGFDSWHKANAVVQRAKEPGNVFRCESCGKWHIGHKRKKRRMVEISEADMYDMESRN